MSRKARLTKKELDLLARAALERPGETAATVLARYIELEGRRVSLSTVEKKLAEWRRNETILPAKATLPTEERPLGQEAPWSLGESAKPEYGITPEATRDLLAVWKYCLATGHVFTIREAWWVARLRTSLKDSEERIGLLFALAHEYALRQQICRVLNKSLDTLDLDVQLCMGDRERIVFEALGLIPRLVIPYHRETMEQASKFFFRMGFASSAATNIAMSNIPRSAFKEANAVEEIVKQFSYIQNLPQVLDRIYAASLAYLSKGPLWNTLSVEKYLQVLSYLRAWVTKWVPTFDPMPYEVLDSQQGGLKPEDILDPNLLEMVGYEVTIKTTSEGGTT